MREVLQSLCSDPGRVLLPGGVRRRSSVVLVLSPPVDEVAEVEAASHGRSEGEGRFGMEAWRVWLQKRAEHISQGGDVCLPGGRIEPGESGEAAALREWEEEMGVPKERVDLLGCFGTHVHFSGQTIQVWLAIGPASLEADLRPNDEVARVLSPTLGQLSSARWTRKPMSLEIVPLPRAPGPPNPARESANARWIAREFPVFYVEGVGEMLWGMTASILAELLRNLYDKGAVSRLPEGL